MFMAVFLQCRNQNGRSIDAISVNDAESVQSSPAQRNADDTLMQKRVGPEVERPQFYAVPIKGLKPLDTFDFELDEFINAQYGERLFSERYKRYGLPEFYRLTEIARPVDTIIGIISTPYLKSSQLMYALTNKVDTLNFDIEHEWTGSDIFDTDSITVLFSLSPLIESEPYRLLLADRLDDLPENYRVPYVEPGGSDYIIRMYVKDSAVRRAEVMRIYDSRTRVYKVRKKTHPRR